MSPDLKVDERDTELDSIRGLLAERGIELRDRDVESGRGSDRDLPDAVYRAHETAERTLDSMSLFMARCAATGC